MRPALRSGQRTGRPECPSAERSGGVQHVGVEWRITGEGRKETAQFGQWRMLVDRATGDWNGRGRGGVLFNHRWLPGVVRRRRRRR